MKIISVGAELSQIYSNHSVRASAITLPFPTRIFQTATSWSFQGTAARSLAQCVSRPSVTQLESVSDTISNAEENNQPQGTETFTMVKVALIQSSDRLASNVAMSTATASFPRGLKTYRSFSAHKAAHMTKSELLFSIFCVRFVHFAARYLLFL